MNAYLHEKPVGMKVTQSFAREAENARSTTICMTNIVRTWMKAVA